MTEFNEAINLLKGWARLTRVDGQERKFTLTYDHCSLNLQLTRTVGPVRRRYEYSWNWDGNNWKQGGREDYATQDLTYRVKELIERMESEEEPSL